MFIAKVAYQDDVRRISFPNTPDFRTLRQAVSGLYEIDNFSLKWIDEDGDNITVGSQSDLEDAIETLNTSQQQGKAIIRLILAKPGEDIATVTSRFLQNSFLDPMSASMQFQDFNGGNNFNRPAQMGNSGLDAQLLESASQTFASPGENFTHSWKIRNTGSINWPKDTTLSRESGPELSFFLNNPLGNLPVGREIICTTQCRAPSHPGSFSLVFRLCNSQTGAKFGPPLQLNLLISPMVDALTRLRNLGFPEQHAKMVLDQCNGDYDKARDRLTLLRSSVSSNAF